MARKKNLVPLFGVAFIVAIISTGVFYGLFVGKLNSASAPPPGAGKVWVARKALDVGTVLKAEDLKEISWPAPPLPAGALDKAENAIGKTLVEPMAANQLLLLGHVAAAHGGTVESGGLGIPQGKRAVSLQVQDSAGVVAMLKPGHRVDIQVVGMPPGAAIQEPQIRTVLENMIVLTVPKEAAARGGSQIVTVLASPREATLLGLADSTAKIRMALRNPIDHKQENPGGVGLTALFRGSGPTSAPSMNAPVTPTSAQVTSKPVAKQTQVQLVVRVAGADWERLAPHVNEVTRGESLQVVTVRQGEPFEAAIETVSMSRLESGKGREAGLRWTLAEKTSTDTSCGLDIQFSPQIESNGHVRVRVQPEVTMATASGVNRRRLNTEVDVADGQSFLVRGFAPSRDLPVLWEKLFAAAQGKPARDLLVIVTPQVIKEVAKGPSPASE